MQEDRRKPKSCVIIIIIIIIIINWFNVDSMYIIKNSFWLTKSNAN